jgi:hypothetical protein
MYFFLTLKFARFLQQDVQTLQFWQQQSPSPLALGLTKKMLQHLLFYLLILSQLVSELFSSKLFFFFSFISVDLYNQSINHHTHTCMTQLERIASQ